MLQLTIRSKHTRLAAMAALSARRKSKNWPMERAERTPRITRKIRAIRASRPHLSGPTVGMLDKRSTQPHVAR